MFHSLPTSAWADGNLADAAVQLSNMAEHPNLSQPTQVSRADESPCILCCFSLSSFIFNMASQNVATQKYSSSRCKIQLDQPVLHEVEAAGDEADVGDVIGVVAPDELDDDDGHVAEEVAQANRADGSRHAMVARRKLAVHVVTGECELSKKIQFFCDLYAYLSSFKYVEEERTIFHSPILLKTIVKNGRRKPMAKINSLGIGQTVSVFIMLQWPT